MAWEVVVGVETHAQLRTRSKIFSAASSAFGAPPNTQASAVDIALPGTLPVLNERAVELALRAALALGCDVHEVSIFARKNYFYPDLPKGYQISQYERPLATGGAIEIAAGSGAFRRITVQRIHMEEDAGKLLHEGHPWSREKSGVDYNRSGVPLIEIVSAPEMHSAAEAHDYLTALRALLLYAGVSDCNMEEGSLRCDANVSVRRPGKPLGTRCEIKNLNSFRFMERAIEFEARRQIEVLEEGGRIEQETRLYDAERDETRSMRSKEDAQDYRYFPDPDLLPLVVSDELIEDIKNSEIDLQAQEGLLAAKKKEVVAINAKYDEDKKRFIEATRGKR